MKANELMIGDWVTGKKWRENPFKLTRTNDNGKYYYGITPDGTQVGPFLLEELEPITLTTKILEKNEFKVRNRYIWEQRDNNCCVKLSIAPKIEIDGEILNERPYILLEVDGATFSLNIIVEYVHELQHALRLCGVEKTIEL